MEENDKISLFYFCMRTDYAVFYFLVPLMYVELQLFYTAVLDVGKLGERWGATMLPFWVHATTAQGSPLEAVLDPTLNNGSHLSYAFQWFIFSIIAVIGYPLILRRNARARVGDIGPSDDAPM